MAERTHHYAVLGDVGGTNARLELSKVVKGAFETEIVKNVFYRTNDYQNGLDEVLEEFLKEFIDTEQWPHIAVIAVACPVHDNIAEKFANSIWPPIDGSEIAQRFKFDSCTLLNDFVAVGYALGLVKDEDTTTVSPGKPENLGIKCAVGPGTGLGVAFVTHHTDDDGDIAPTIYPVEAAHSVFAAQDDEEIEFRNFFLKKNPSHTYFHAESAFCGPTIPVMYEFFNKKEGKDEPCKLDGKEIFTLAKKGEDKIAQKALDFFFKLYAEFVSNWAINLMPHGGIYLVGGLTVSLKDEITKEDGVFIKNYFNKDFLNSKLKLFPIRIVHEVELGLLGCFALAQRQVFPHNHILAKNVSSNVVQ